MAAVRARAANITAGGQRKRLVKGAIGVAVGVVAAGALIALGVSPGWLALLFIPFWLGALALLQAREKT